MLTKKYYDGFTVHDILNKHLDDGHKILELLTAFADADGVDAVPVERDNPKAPTDQQLEEDGYGAWGSLYGKCPNCGKSVYDEQNYCEKCGQRLDWGNGDPNGFNDETVQALKDTTEGKNLSKVYETLDDMYEDMGDLVRCRDCKYYGADEETLYCERLDLLDFPGHSETSFCSWAERKDHETD